MKKQKSRVNVTVSALDVSLKGMTRPHAYAATDAFSRQVIAIKIYDGETPQNMDDFINCLNELESGLTLEE